MPQQCCCTQPTRRCFLPELHCTARHPPNAEGASRALPAPVSPSSSWTGLKAAATANVPTRREDLKQTLYKETLHTSSLSRGAPLKDSWVAVSFRLPQFRSSPALAAAALGLRKPRQAPQALSFRAQTPPRWRRRTPRPVGPTGAPAAPRRAAPRQGRTLESWPRKRASLPIRTGAQRTLAWPWPLSHRRRIFG